MQNLYMSKYNCGVSYACARGETGMGIKKMTHRKKSIVWMSLALLTEVKSQRLYFLKMLIFLKSTQRQVFILYMLLTAFINSVWRE